jgi:hypothetical protein
MELMLNGRPLDHGQQVRGCPIAMASKLSPTRPRLTPRPKDAACLPPLGRKSLLRRLIASSPSACWLGRLAPHP